MKTLQTMLLLGLCCFLVTGCSGDKKDTDKGKTETKKTSIETSGCDCEKCCEDCCDENAEKCECVTEGSESCCTGLAPEAGKCCLKSGEKAETATCCKEGAECCTEKSGNDQEVVVAEDGDKDAS